MGLLVMTDASQGRCQPGSVPVSRAPKHHVLEGGDLAPQIVVTARRQQTVAERGRARSVAAPVEPGDQRVERGGCVAGAARSLEAREALARRRSRATAIVRSARPGDRGTERPRPPCRGGIRGAAGGEGVEVEGDRRARGMRASASRAPATAVASPLSVPPGRKPCAPDGPTPTRGLRMVSARAPEVRPP